MITDWCKEQLDILAGCIKDLSCMVGTVSIEDPSKIDQFIADKLNGVYKRADDVQRACD